MSWGDWSRADKLGLVRYVTTEAENFVTLPGSSFDLRSKPKGQRLVAEAIYKALAGMGIMYDIERYHPSNHLQPIRTPAEILQAPKKGTCLDLALLFCGLCLANRLLPILIVVEGHALAAVSLGHWLDHWDAHRWENTRFVDAQLTDDGPLVELLSGDDPAYLAVECTGFARAESLPSDVPEGTGRVDGLLGFAEAVEAGRRQLSGARRFSFALDVAVARYGWSMEPHPLPGEYLFPVDRVPRDPEGAAAALDRIRRLGRRKYAGPLRRRLDPLVLVNRREELERVSRFFAEGSASVLYIHGGAGMGKSTVARGALELQTLNVPAVWAACEGLDAERLLSVIDQGLGLGVEALHDAARPLNQKLDAVLGSITQQSILVLDGLEALLDADGQYRSKTMADLMEALTTAEHRAKAMVTTRHLPKGASEAMFGVEILRLPGLSLEMARALFEVRARLTPERSLAVLPLQALERLRGHPKYIELIAAAVADFADPKLATNLLAATDLEEYVMNQVVSRLSEDELKVLRAGAVFREVFLLDALAAVCFAERDGDRVSILKVVRGLVRRAVLDTATASAAFYLHPILRDTVRPAPPQEAEGHAAAARWYLRHGVVAGDASTWDDDLYHLRRAAEVGRDTRYFQPYRDFVLEHMRALSFAGFGRRMVTELKTVAALAEDTEDYILVRWVLANELFDLDDNAEAVVVLRELDALLEATKDEVGEWAFHFLFLVKAKLGNTLAETGDLEGAKKMADGLAPFAEKTASIQERVRYAELRFAIARKGEDVPEILRWAAETHEWAKRWVEEDPSPQTKDALAESHFGLAIAYLWTDNHPEMIRHLGEQLRLKREIGKISGVAAGLFNGGMLLQYASPVEAGALVITAYQIKSEIGQAFDPREEMTTSLIRRFIERPHSAEEGRQAIASISDQLLPYYERALARRSHRSGETADR